VRIIGLTPTSAARLGLKRVEKAVAVLVRTTCSSVMEPNRHSIRRRMRTMRLTQVNSPAPLSSLTAIATLDRAHFAATAIFS
jgi:hypothetical protein